MAVFEVRDVNEVEVHGVLYEFLCTQYKRDSRPSMLMLDLLTDRAYVLYEDMRYRVIRDPHEVAMLLITIGSLNEQQTATIGWGLDLRIHKSKRLERGAIYTPVSSFE